MTETDIVNNYRFHFHPNPNYPDNVEKFSKKQLFSIAI